MSGNAYSAYTPQTKTTTKNTSSISFSICLLKVRFITVYYKNIIITTYVHRPLCRQTSCIF